MGIYFKFFFRSLKIMNKLKEDTEVIRDYTINLHKRCHKVTFKKKAPRAMKEIKKFASKVMGTCIVKLDPSLNKFIWSKGIRNIPRRVRVRISKKLNEVEEDETFYSFVSHVEGSSKGLCTQIV